MSADRVIYLDSSAITKLVVRERESSALRRYLRGRSVVSSALARVEVSRAVLPLGTAAARRARDVLAGINLVNINNRVLTGAATMQPADLRSLDAIHLATAALFGRTLARFVCYDTRLSDAAKARAWSVVAPS